MIHRYFAWSWYTLTCLYLCIIYCYFQEKRSYFRFRQLSVVADYAYEDQSVVERRFRLLLSFSKFAAWSHLAPSWRLLRHETRSEQADVQEVGSMLKSRSHTSSHKKADMIITPQPVVTITIMSMLSISA